MENPIPIKIPIYKKPWLQSVIGIILILAVLGGLLYWKSISSYVLIDNSEISAPIINIGPEAEGVLSAIYVKPGDNVVTDEAVARVGGELLSAKTAGVVVSVQNTPGQVFMPGSPVVSMIDPQELRVVGKIDEDKGLAYLKVGQPATFTVDAFGSREFDGVVSEISPMSNQNDIVFSISDKREVKKFDIKVRFDVTKYNMLKQGMSARIKIFTNSYESSNPK